MRPELRERLYQGGQKAPAHPVTQFCERKGPPPAQARPELVEMRELTCSNASPPNPVTAAAKRSSDGAPDRGPSELLKESDLDSTERASGNHVLHDGRQHHPVDA